MTDTIMDYLAALRRHNGGDASALDKYRPLPQAPKAVGKQPEPKHGPRQGGLGL